MAECSSSGLETFSSCRSHHHVWKLSVPRGSCVYLLRASSYISYPAPSLTRIGPPALTLNLLHNHDDKIQKLKFGKLLDDHISIHYGCSADMSDGTEDCIRADWSRAKVLKVKGSAKEEEEGFGGNIEVDRNVKNTVKFSKL